MTITTQWLIFGGMCIALFVWGLLAKNGGPKNSDAKEEHTLRQKNLMSSEQLESDEHDHIAVGALTASRR